MDDLIGDFITETSEALAVLDLELVKLEQDPNNQPILGNIFRLVHTIKGTCGFLGLPRLESVAHAAENVLGKIREGEIAVSEDAISIVLEGIDRVKGLIEHLTQHGREPSGDDKDLIARLNQFAQVSRPTPSAEALAAFKPVQLLMEEDVVGRNAMPEPVSSLSQAELDELERTFANTACTLPGGEDFTRASETLNAGLYPDSELYAVAVVPPKPTFKPTLSDTAKLKAIRQGLATTGREIPASAPPSQSIRVNIDVLENLMQMVGELVLTRNQLLQVARHRDDRELKGPLQQLSLITTELQDNVMKTRMQPIGNAWSKFPRLIRDLSYDLNKKIELRMIGESTELDRQLLEMIKDPLTHMVRNSCDHGLETVSERLAVGKSDTGTVTLSAFHDGGHIIIEVSDDGRGLNITRIRQKIIERDLASAEDLAELSDEQVMQFIFRPGFSTADSVSSVSGRGVGMDVVRTNIEKIGGTVSLASVMGKGSVFHIKIPLTLAIVSVLLVECSSQKFAIPQINILELVRVGAESDYRIEKINNAAVLRLRDKLLPLMKLRDILKLPAPEAGKRVDEYVAVLRVGVTDFGLIIDRIFDTEEIVVKPVTRVLSDIEVYSGNTILGDGSVIMILDPNSVAKSFGELDLSTKDLTVKDEVAVAAALAKEKLASFLVFRAGPGAPKAVPLELVSRLEVIAADTVERSGQEHVVQYRGEIMRLKVLPEMTIPTTGSFEVVVFTYDNRTVGLVVDGITDIIEAPVRIKIAALEEYFLGSSVIAGKTTDIVDVGYLLSHLVDDMNHISRLAPKVNGMHILLVEDSPFFRKLTVPFLEHAGYTVSVATGPREALEMVVKRGVHFDIVVTDIEMPEMDGFELVTLLHDHVQMDNIPIIAFTSTINDAYRQRGIKAGIDAIIIKTDREALLMAIAQQLNLNKESVG